jgi:hypothetical protein
LWWRIHTSQRPSGSGRLPSVTELAAELGPESYLFRRVAMTGPARWTTPLAVRAAVALGLAW